MNNLFFNVEKNSIEILQSLFFWEHFVKKVSSLVVFLPLFFCIGVVSCVVLCCKIMFVVTDQF